MKRIFVLLWLLIPALHQTFAQVVTLEQCQIWAAENYPVISQRQLVVKTTEFNVANARRNWLPQVTISAQATYQSDVPGFPDEFNNLLSMAGIDMDGLPRDQYNVAVELRQTIWDGGITSAQVAAAKADGEVQRQSVEVEMYNLRGRVNDIFFGMLLLQENLAIADIHIEEIERNMRLIEVYINEGVAGISDSEQLKAELLSVRQQRSELANSLKAYRVILGIMTGREIGENTELLKPAVDVLPEPAFNERPEMKLLDARANLLDAQRKGVNASIMPRIGLFVQGGYGIPGLDMFETMLENKWSLYYIGGIRFEWNLGGLYTNRNKMSQINLGLSQVDSQRETFLYNMQLSDTRERLANERLREVMRDDDGIISLRSSIRSRTQYQIENGAATVNDLIRDTNAENLALRNRSVHEIELLKNIYDIKYSVNN